MEAGRGTVELNTGRGSKAAAKNAYGRTDRAQRGNQRHERADATVITVDTALAVHASSRRETEELAACMLHGCGISSISGSGHKVVKRRISAAGSHLEDLPVTAGAAPYCGAV